MSARTVIVVVTYESARYLPALLGSLARNTPAGSYQLWVIDNASKDDSVEIVKRESTRLGLNLWIEVMTENLGFTGANDAAYRLLREKTEWHILVLLNPDTEVQEGWLPPMEQALEKESVGTASALLLLPEGTLNSRGNRMHYLGFGFVDGLGESVETAKEGSIFFGSGAALAVSRRALVSLMGTGSDEGVFWNRLGMYGEDVDLGWRMRMAGFENVVVPASRVTHHYVFIAERPDVRRLRLIERNRWLVLISNYRIPTLCLLLPALLGLELVLWLGWNRKMFGSRLELWREIVRGLDAEFWRRRNHLQRTRRVGDRSILCHMTGVLQHGAMKESFGLKLANAVGGLYFSLLRACVWW